MKQTMLITGKDNAVKEELFAHFWTDFECLTCSGGCEDIKNHLNHFTPDVLVYCLCEEVSGEQTILELQEILEKEEIVLAVVGSKKDCGAFVSRAPKLARFAFEKPLDFGLIADCLINFMEQKAMDDLLHEIDTFETRKSIMVIDDDPFMQKLMTEYLQKEYVVRTATSGKAAMKYLLKKTVDLILLDYEMPDESGPEVLEQLHQNRATRDIPVIFLTSMMQREMIEKALRLKPQGYLLKPVKRDKLLEAIQNILG